LSARTADDAIWQGRIVSEATLSSRISAARRALGDSGNDQTFIRTTYKRGFRFVGDVDDGSSDSVATAKAPLRREVPHESTALVPAAEATPLPLQNMSLDSDRDYVTQGPAVAMPAPSEPHAARAGRTGQCARPSGLVLVSSSRLARCVARSLHETCGPPSQGSVSPFNNECRMVAVVVFTSTKDQITLSGASETRVDGLQGSHLDYRASLRQSRR
jgi:hypothetical protein